MNKKACLYTVVRYIPDPVKNEARNIGIIAQCRDVGYINCRFLKKINDKLGTNIATQLDIKAVKSYIGEFIGNFEPFSKFPSTGRIFPEDNEFLSQDYLNNLADRGFGKVQFTIPQGSLTDNPEKELRYLFSTFVSKKEIQEEKRAKRSRLKTEIKSEFIKRKWLAPTGEKQARMFEIDKKFKGHSKVEHSVDFALENGNLFLVETVDMRKKERDRRALETFEAALKFDDLRRALIKIEPYSVVALSDQVDDNRDFLKILNEYSQVFLYSEEKERNKFLDEMGKLAAPIPLFKE